MAYNDDSWWIPKHLKKKKDNYSPEEEREKNKRNAEKRRLQRIIMENQKIIDENERLDAQDKKRELERGPWELF